LFLVWGGDYVIRPTKDEDALNKIDDERRKAWRLCNVAEDENAEDWSELTSQGDLRQEDLDLVRRDQSKDIYSQSSKGIENTSVSTYIEDQEGITNKGGYMEPTWCHNKAWSHDVVM
jgi:hypothetical protein